MHRLKDKGENDAPTEGGTEKILHRLNGKRENAASTGGEQRRWYID